MKNPYFSIDHSYYYPQKFPMPKILSDETLNILAISGGGCHGPFSAGILSGLSQINERKNYHVITGISIGALISIFAFLGSSYDGYTKEIIDDENLFKPVSSTHIRSLLLGRSLYSQNALKGLVDKVCSNFKLKEVAKEYKKGRILIICTLDTLNFKFIGWNIGEIAQQGTQEAFDLIRSIIVASMSFSGAFPHVTLPDQIINPTDSFSLLHTDPGPYSSFYCPGHMVLRTQKPATIDIIINNTLFEKNEPKEKNFLNLLSDNITIASTSNTKLLLSLLSQILSNTDTVIRYASLEDGCDPHGAIYYELEFVEKIYNLGLNAALNGTAWKYLLKDGRIYGKNNPITLP